MDIGAFKDDLAKEAVKLPRELLEILQKLAAHFGPTLEGSLPAMVENLKPHIQVIMMEAAMGVLDKKELEHAITDVLGVVLNAKGG